MRIVLTVTLVFVNILLAAYVFKYIWALFAVPLGAPVIGAVHAYGLLLLLQAPSAASAVSTTVTLNRMLPEHGRDAANLTSSMAVSFTWAVFAGFAAVAASFLR